MTYGQNTELQEAVTGGVFSGSQDQYTTLGGLHTARNTVLRTLNNLTLICLHLYVRNSGPSATCKYSLTAKAEVKKLLLKIFSSTQTCLDWYMNI